MQDDAYQLSVDKFMFRVMRDRLYSEKDVWVKGENGCARIGVTDFFQRRGGDIVYIELPETDKKVMKGEEIVQLETIKAILTVESPLDGKVVQVNMDLLDKPEKVNEDPYGLGWIALISHSSEGDLETLLSPENYFELMRGKVDSELEKSRR